jgi:hypothetical protein
MDAGVRDLAQLDQLVMRRKPQLEPRCPEPEAEKWGHVHQPSFSG